MTTLHADGALVTPRRPQHEQRPGHATRFGAAVALAVALVCPAAAMAQEVKPWPELVEAFGDDVKKIAPTFEALFGDELARVAKSKSTADDLLLAKRLLVMAERSVERPTLLALAAQHAYELGLSDAKGYETSDAAIQLMIDKLPPATTPLWKNRQLAVRLRRMDLLDDKQKIELAGELLGQMDGLAVKQSEKGDWAGAAATWAEAARIAGEVKHPDAAAFTRKHDEALARKKALDDAIAKAKAEAEMAAKMKAEAEARAKVERQKAALARLIVERDDPRSALALARELGDDAAAAKLTLASQTIGELKPDDAAAVGKWYVTLAAEAKEESRVRMMIRAWRLFDRYLDQHTLRDAGRAEVEFAQSALTRDLSDAGIDANQLLRLDRPRPLNVESVVNDLGVRLVKVQPARFAIGSPDSEPGRRAVELGHNVEITRPFAIGATEITQHQWQRVMGNNPSKAVGDDLPVDSVTWLDAMAFCKRLGESDGRTYRLPTEAEWELACRATTTGRFADNSYYPDAIAWYEPNADGRAHPVATKLANAWGLYDMHGNVAEWCLDFAEPFGAEASVDPRGPATGTERIVRGGSFASPVEAVRSAARLKAEPDRASPSIGFRIVLVEKAENEAGDAGDDPAKPVADPLDPPSDPAKPVKPPTFFGIPTDK